MRRFLCAAVLLAGCDGGPGPAPRETGPANERLPSLALQYVSTTLENSPAGLTGGFTIGPQGLLFNFDNRGDGLLYSVIDSSGAVINRLGRSGDGPGEISGGVIDVSDSAFIVSAMSQGRLSRFTLDGSPLESGRITEQVFPRIAVTGTDVLGERFQREGAIPVTVSVATGQVRPLLTGTDSFMTSFPHPGSLLPDGSVKIPVLGRWSGGFIAADGFDYRLALYSWDGAFQRILHRDIPPPHLSERRVDRELKQDLTFLRKRRTMGAADVAHYRDEIASRRRPFFYHNRDSQIGLDGEGRIWVLGVDADSGFADVFSSTKFLGRLPLPCPGFEQGWSLKGNWLVIACQPEDPDFDGDAVFKVFRIKG